MEAPGTDLGTEAMLRWAVSGGGVGLWVAKAGSLSGPPCYQLQRMAKLCGLSEPPCFQQHSVRREGGRTQQGGVCNVFVSTVPDTWVLGAVPTGTPRGGCTPRGLGGAVGGQATSMAERARVAPGFYGYPCAIPGLDPMEQRHGKLGLSHALVDGISQVLS